MKPVFEKVNKAPDVSFACFEFSGPSFLCPYHVHPEFEITQIVSSTGRRLIGDHISEFIPDDFVMIGSGLPHMYFNTPKSRANWARSRVVQFKADCFGTSFFELPEMRRVAQLLNLSHRGLRFEAKTTRLAISIFDRIYSASGPKRIAHFIELLELLARSPGTEPLASVNFQPGSEHRSSERMNRVIDYVNKHLRDHITLAGAARAARMTPHALSRFFRRLMGRTFIEYVVELRIGAACRALIETDQTITEICYQCGFNNLSNFNRHFLRFKNLTPSEFRQKSPAQAN